MCIYQNENTCIALVLLVAKGSDFEGQGAEKRTVRLLMKGSKMSECSVNYYQFGFLSSSVQKMDVDGQVARCLTPPSPRAVKRITSGKFALPYTK